MQIKLTMLLFLLTLSSYCMASPRSGQSIYNSICVRCHNQNPTKHGPIGPDLYGSSLELITKKTQERTYPKGYKPKRKTNMMPKIPMEKSEIQDLHKYINNFGGKK